MFNLFRFGVAKDDAVDARSNEHQAGSATKLKVRQPVPIDSAEFAVVDVETTGVLKGRDRVIEIAVVNCDSQGNITQEYSTLVNPKRDLGPTNIHGIMSAYMDGAPEFVDIAGDLIAKLKGSIVAGHNVSFDIGMVESEYARLKHVIPEPTSVCTLKLAYEFGPSNRKLVECCRHFGIEADQWHSALCDAHATVRLLAQYLDIAKRQGYTHLHELRGFHDADQNDIWPDLSASGKVRRREHYVPRESHYISDLVARLPPSGCSDIQSYLLVLDRMLEDRRVTADEGAELANLAISAGLGREQVVNAHREYLASLVQIALEDGVVTGAERLDLENVARLLGLDSQELDSMISDSRKTSTSPVASVNAYGQDLQGKKVCFTGVLTSKIGGTLITRERAISIAQNAGLIPVDSVTKKTDLLVIADPDSLSGKAKKARDYGIRIMAERAFWKALGESVE